MSPNRIMMILSKKDDHDYDNNDNIPGDDGEVERAVSEVGQLRLHRHHLCLDQVGEIQIQFLDQVGQIL